ncbi:hypothetical protein CC80DRAFT_193786 [Byssothecium circinans]|uniref:Nucleotidyltransferase n=1 Tax=Byssothecium circinans TaxID=147558 RepID=A0A6A5TI06_9PLEO|nr:hypothetical protein CC80DRAFT_193786 [Byssothecium circinans]
MITERLNDAAIALQKVLGEAGVRFGIFGGYAVSVLGGVRESKDVDCIVALSREQVIAALDKRAGFSLIPQTRQDYVAFFWSEKANSTNPVLVEIFCEQFPGSKFNMSRLGLSEVAVNGQAFGQSYSTFADPFSIFKGKLCAAATREKFHDSADLRTLLSRYPDQIKARIGEVNLNYVGLAIKRYSVLERTFQELGVDVERAKGLAKNINEEEPYPRGIGQIQYALLG